MCSIREILFSQKTPYMPILHIISNLHFPAALFHTCSIQTRIMRSKNLHNLVTTVEQWPDKQHDIHRRRLDRNFGSSILQNTCFQKHCHRSLVSRVGQDMCAVRKFDGSQTALYTLQVSAGELRFETKIPHGSNRQD